METTLHTSLGPHFVLASILAAYPCDDFSEHLSVLLEDIQASEVPNSKLEQCTNDLLARLKKILAHPEQIDEVRSEYIDIFDRGKEVNSLYESEYSRMRAMAKGTLLADIAGFYRAFGYEVGGEGAQSEMLDHIAVELEFYALLLLKDKMLMDRSDLQGVEVVMDARKKFLKDHLGKFVEPLSLRPSILGSQFYSTVFNFCNHLIAEECKKLEINVEKETWVGGEEPEGMKCGATLDCTKGTLNARGCL